MSTSRSHKDPEVITKFLDWLDETAPPTDEAEGRRSKRYRYRAGFEVELLLPSGRVRHKVPSRNLNRHGASFLLGQFVYPGTICQIHLVNLKKQRQTVTARVVRCRYLEGSSTLHEVGVHFIEPIDVDSLIDVVGSLKEKPLFSSLADDPEMSELIDQFVKDLSGKVGELKNSFAQHDYEMLSRIARMLKGGAGTYGFQPITDAAAEVEKAISENLDESGIRVQLDELIRICTSARSAT